MVNFDKRYLLGWQAGYTIKTYALLIPWQRQWFMSRSGTCVLHNLEEMFKETSVFKTTLSNQTFKHIYLPLWLSSYEYNGRIYHVLINGQTGKVIGDKPLSWIKISLLLFSFLLIIFVIWWLRESGVVRI
ncbi:MAG: hypothetical protein IPI90_10665 [Saprospiraceae bacterium]|nr:hypothetical protein [Candidatus Vicinibacter affinis]